ncbi:MAG: sensor histidine kinase [Gammaproteobacteria bacterium]|nr:MAG: sensor histidine kinase [Gammaproteobacteria bacterium]
MSPRRLLARLFPPSARGLFRLRTLRGMAMAALALLTLPLLGAVGYASVTLDQLARGGQVIVEHGVRATQISQQTFNLLGQLERHAREYNASGDGALFDAYERTRIELVLTLAELTTLPQDADARRARAALARQSAELGAALLAAAQRGEALDERALTLRLGVLINEAEGLSRHLRALLDGELAGLQARVRTTRTALMWQTLLLAPVLSMMMGFLYLRVLRPLRQIDSAIARLGEEQLDEPVRIEGPQDIRALGRQLEWLRERLSELAQEKSRFLRHMSHELKTPLANIREGTELLLDGAVGPLQPGQEEVTRILRDNGIRLQQLIENLLAFSAWQSRNATLELSAFPLPALFEEVLRRHRLVIASQQLQITRDIAPLTVRADHEKLRLVLENLVSNAIKFSPKQGTVHLQGAAHGEWLQLDVIDEGPGIPQGERHRVFEAFYQGSERATAHVGGTGIGLSVVLECITAHGGTVEIIDGRERGAHLRVRLPLRPASASTAAKPPAAAAGAINSPSS